MRRRLYKCLNVINSVLCDVSKDGRRPQFINALRSEMCIKPAPQKKLFSASGSVMRYRMLRNWMWIKDFHAARSKETNKDVNVLHWHLWYPSLSCDKAFSLDPQCHVPPSKLIIPTGKVCNDKPVFARLSPWSDLPLLEADGICYCSWVTTVTLCGSAVQRTTHIIIIFLRGIAATLTFTFFWKVWTCWHPLKIVFCRDALLLTWQLSHDSL